VGELQELHEAVPVHHRVQWNALQGAYSRKVPMRKKELKALVETTRRDLETCHQLLYKYAEDIDKLIQHTVTTDNKIAEIEKEKDVLRYAFHLATGRLAAHQGIDFDNISAFADALISEAEQDAQD